VGDSDAGDDQRGDRPSARLASVAEVDFDALQTDPQTPEILYDVDEGSAEKLAADKADLVEGTKVGEYEVEAKIGEGAMGTVYRAKHPAIGKIVAIKVISPRVFAEPDAVKRFVAEARAVAAIRHPGIVHVFGFGRLTDNRTYLTMEWLDGESLGERLQRGPFSLPEALDIVRQIARALEAAHAKDIVHRDLKPDNVFLQTLEDEPPVVKLLDFGLAKVVKRDDMLVARTRTGQILGTPLYMSPEQCRAKNVDHRTDIYALGCMCYELFAGRVPFDHDNSAELISAHLTTEPPRPRSLNQAVSRDLDALLPQMIAKDPDQRPTLADLRKTIQTLSGRVTQPIAAVTPAVDVLPSYVSTRGAMPELDDDGDSARAAIDHTAIDVDKVASAEPAPVRTLPIVLAVVAGGIAVALGILIVKLLRGH
jgi:serine/threonine protein kinase